MGCSVSRLEDDGDASSGLVRPIRRRIEEIRRRGMIHGSRVGKDSIVSTTELLRREEDEDATTVTTEEEVSRGDSRGDSLNCEGVCSVCGAHPSSLPRESTSSTTPPTMTIMSPVAEVEEGATTEAEAVAASRWCAGVSEEIQEEGEEEEGEEKKKEIAVEGDEEADEKDERKRGEEQENGREEKQKGEVDERAAVVVGGGGRLGYDEEELPGSPSFRVYFVESLRESSDDDSADSGVSDSGKTDQKDWKSSIDSTTLEYSEGKSTKKHMGRRLKALRKGHNAVYGLLNVRSCYNHGDHGPHPNHTPALLTEKVA